MEDGTRFVWLWNPRTRQLVELWHFGRKSRLYSRFARIRGFDHGLVFSVVDSAPLVRRLRRLGGKVGKPLALGGVQLTLVKDPDGHTLEILSRPEGSAGRTSKPPFLTLATSIRPP